MWVLESDGDALQGKKLWLRPGKRFIFGRTKAEGNFYVISNKTISRQHLIVEVGTPLPTDYRNPQTRTTLTLQDCDTKIGTLVNGEQIRGKTHMVTSGDNVVALGRYEYHFRFVWEPTNLTVPFTAKEAKANPHAALYEVLGPLDIKVLADYDREFTTHLVVKKRNTSKGLQALINGRYIVHNDRFLKALIAACTSPVDGSKAQCPLEEDWDANFPDPLDYLPPRGEEPTQRDATAYSPNPERQNMFDGYTFVFYDTRQFETLLAPISEGGGKALLEAAIPSETRVDKFVRYVKSVAGEKGLGSFEDGSEGKGVVVVRFNPVRGAGIEWYADFNREVSLYLDHRLVEQNEFLDAILGGDASVLRRPLEFVQSGVDAPPPSVVTAMNSQRLRSSPPPYPGPTPAGMAPPEPARRGRSRRMAANGFTAFDEEFNSPSLRPVPESMAVDSTSAVESQSLFVSQEAPRVELDCEGSQSNTQRGGRKRSTPPVDYDNSQDLMDAVAPAAQAFKKRKLAEESARRQGGESTPPPAASESKSTAKTKAKPSKKEIDVQERLAKRQAEMRAEELARSELEDLKETLDGMDIDAIRNLAIIEEMSVTRRQPPHRSAAQADESDRWDDRWNGRKNFKKFKRRGADSTGPRASKVIVPLEEVRKKDFGIGDEYWLEGEADASRNKKKKGKGKCSQETQTQSHTKTKDSAARSAEILGSNDEDEYALPADEEDTRVVSSDVEVVAPPPEPAVRSQRGSKLADKTNESQNLPSQRGNKRTAVALISKPAPAKKARPAPVEEPSDDDSDDGLKFRFGRK